MSVTTKKIVLNTVLLAGLALGSTTVFAGGGSIVPGTIDPCENLPLAVDLDNGNNVGDGNNVCVNVPVRLNNAKVVFNIDNVITDDLHQSVALKHMGMLVKVLKNKIDNGELSAGSASVVGLFHGTAMSKGKWGTTLPAADPVTKAVVDGQITSLLAYAAMDPAIEVQLEDCGTTIRGMAIKSGNPIDEHKVYSGVLVNQGAIARLIDLQSRGYVYIQEGADD